MIHQATQEISNVFTMRDIRHLVEESGNLSYVEAGFTGKNVQNVRVRFLSADEENDVAVRVSGFGAVRVSAAKRPAMLRCLSDLNWQYRYVKFCLGSEGDISVEYDLPVEALGENVGAICREIFIRFMRILDDKIGRAHV